MERLRKPRNHSMRHCAKNAVHRGLYDRSQDRPVSRLRPHAARDCALAPDRQRRAAAIMALRRAHDGRRLPGAAGPSRLTARWTRRRREPRPAVLVVYAGGTAGVAAYGDPTGSHAPANERLGHPASRHAPRARGADRTRSRRAICGASQINGVATPMVVDTGASSVVLTYETAKPPACRWNCSTTTSNSRPPADTPGPRV